MRHILVVLNETLQDWAVFLALTNYKCIFSGLGIKFVIH